MCTQKLEVGDRVSLSRVSVCVCVCVCVRKRDRQRERERCLRILDPSQHTGIILEELAIFLYKLNPKSMNNPDQSCLRQALAQEVLQSRGEDESC